MIIKSDDLNDFSSVENLYLNLVHSNDTIISKVNIETCGDNTFSTEFNSPTAPARYQIEGFDNNGIPFKHIVLDEPVMFEGGIWPIMHAYKYI